MLIRLVADLIVNHFTTYFFLRGKTVNLQKYEEHNKRPSHDEDELELLDDEPAGLARHNQLADDDDDEYVAGPLARGARRSSTIPTSDQVPV